MHAADTMEHGEILYSAVDLRRFWNFAPFLYRDNEEIPATFSSTVQLLCVPHLPKRPVFNFQAQAKGP